MDGRRKGGWISKGGSICAIERGRGTAERQARFERGNCHTRRRNARGDSGQRVLQRSVRKVDLFEKGKRRVLINKVNCDPTHGDLFL